MFECSGSYWKLRLRKGPPAMPPACSPCLGSSSGSGLAGGSLEVPCRSWGRLSRRIVREIRASRERVSSRQASSVLISDISPCRKMAISAGSNHSPLFGSPTRSQPLTESLAVDTGASLLPPFPLPPRREMTVATLSASCRSGWCEEKITLQKETGTTRWIATKNFRESYWGRLTATGAATEQEAGKLSAAGGERDCG